MKRKRKSVGITGFIVFVALILVGGYVLNSAGYIDNPFDEMAFLSNWANGGEERFEQSFAVDAGSTTFSLPPVDASAVETDLTALDDTASQFQLPPVEALTSVTTTTSSTTTDVAGSFDAEAFEGGERSDQNAIAWDSLGDVLYNVWFICATTAVFIVVQYLFKLSLKQVKNRLPAMAAAK